MSSTTDNLNLVKQANNENWSNDIHNANLQKIDDFAGGFGQFTYVYKGGLGHVTGETRVDKFKRAYQANAFPVGKPFFGYISAGSQLLVMGYLYMSNNQLYGSGYIASYDGYSIIRVQADNFYDAFQNHLTIRTLGVSYTCPASGQFNTNLYTAINNDLPAGAKCLGIAGWTTNEVDVYVVGAYYSNSNWSLQLKNNSTSSTKTNNCNIHYLCAL